MKLFPKKVAKMATLHDSIEDGSPPVNKVDAQAEATDTLMYNVSQTLRPDSTANTTDQAPTDPDNSNTVVFRETHVPAQPHTVSFADEHRPDTTELDNLSNIEDDNSRVTHNLFSSVDNSFESTQSIIEDDEPHFYDSIDMTTTSKLVTRK